MAGLAAHPELGSLARIDGAILSVALSSSQRAQPRTRGQPSHFCGWDASRGLGALPKSGWAHACRPSLAGPTRRLSLDGRTQRPSLDGPTRRPSLAGPMRRPGLVGHVYGARPRVPPSQAWAAHRARLGMLLARRRRAQLGTATPGWQRGPIAGSAGQARDQATWPSWARRRLAGNAA